KRVTEIAIVFKEAPHLLFGKRADSIRPNVLSIRIQPDEGIALNFGSKLPGPAMEVAPVSMEFRYGSSFGFEPPEAYERLLLDCLLGDGTLFTRADEVEASWTWVSRIHRRWAEQAAAGDMRLPEYAAGTWGPGEAERELSSLWQQASQTAGAAVSRAVLWNLVVPTRGAKGLEKTKALCDAIAPAVPVRAIALCLDETAGDQPLTATIDSNVVSQPSGGRTVYCEEISLMGPPGAETHFGAMVRALQVPGVR